MTDKLTQEYEEKNLFQKEKLDSLCIETNRVQEELKTLQTNFSQETTRSD